MSLDCDWWEEVEERFAALEPADQSELLERLCGRLRKKLQGEDDWDDRMRQMAEDPDILREMNVLPPDGQAPKSQTA